MSRLRTTARRLLLAGVAAACAGACHRRDVAGASATAVEPSSAPAGDCKGESLVPLREAPVGRRSCAAFAAGLPMGDTLLACWDGAKDGVAVVRHGPRQGPQVHFVDDPDRGWGGNAVGVGSGTVTYPVQGWALDRIDQTGAGADVGELVLANGGEDARIWVVDSGVAEIAELKGRVRRDLVVPLRECPGVDVCTPHGTHVASLAAGAVHGVARDAEVVPVPVLDRNGKTCATDLVRAFRAIAERVGTDPGVRDVVNVSIELTTPCATSEDGVCEQLDLELDLLRARGAVVVVAAGNEGDEPADCYGLSRNEAALVVGGFDRAGGLQGRGGSRVDVLAPGSAVKVGGPKDREEEASGTSVAAPLVAGFAAVMRTDRPGARPEQISAALVDWASTATPPHKNVTSKVLCTRLDGNCPPSTPPR